MKRDWFDISMRLDPATPTWPGDPSVETSRVADYDSGGARVTSLSMSVHSGTHIDAPAHYLENGLTIDSMPLDVMVGPCVVIEVRGAQRIGAAELRRFDLVEAERVLLRTDNSHRGAKKSAGFDPDFCHLTPDGASFLVDRRIRCIGIDALSIGGGDDNAQTHRTLMRAGIWIIEGLDLRAVEPADYELFCAPLRMTGLEAAPARALLGRRGTGDETPEFIEDAVEFASKTG